MVFIAGAYFTTAEGITYYADARTDAGQIVLVDGSQMQADAGGGTVVAQGDNREQQQYQLQQQQIAVAIQGRKK
jgi:hypothetical protein